MLSPRGGIGICGVGAVTGYGWGRQALWEGLRTAKPAAVLTPGYGCGTGDTGDGGDGRGTPAEDGWVARVPEGGDTSDGRGRFGRAMRAAAREAIEDAHRRGWNEGRTVGLLHAVVLGEVELWRDFYLREHGDIRARDYLALMPSTPMSTLMQEYGFHGPAMNVSAMCASGNAALLTAKLWLDAGVVDDVVLVATDLSLTPENVRHFVRLGVTVVDTDPLDGCRPFQEGSRGFVMGEAAVGFVLSRQSGTPYTTLLGGAMSHDAHHATSIDPELTQVRRSFREALDNAGVRADAVGYLNAHGPGTRQCDTAEAAIADELFPDDVGLYSVKPLVGHCQGAAAAVEIAVTALGYERGQVPAPPQVARAHPRLLHGLVDVDDRLTLKSSLGMGGHNSVVVLAPPA
ncbi:beta-ketoacyl synthase N-terminal-like domain-containing protein [Saccharomonospora xinjiangensis]|uniref:beta-ketoacyl synthase N-terminal-like domain-containing protein n=1 Tax=Saccharomonospora xinjiangensis TaxID=75294 RepID=UPI0010705520|nr:beta-ketoacyl synthase N-terminal-like domain-containing protein [Saccharomonospora xinjiangensis]QBQ62434.1 3-oxoacyl-[acyl-carrier-protein] synthase 2 [Saccharomonospora xinjiangensis]